MEVENAVQQDIVDVIDSRLLFLEELDFQPGWNDNFQFVYLVDCDGQNRILKGAKCDGRMPKQLYTERRALLQAEDVPGITHLCNDYGISFDESGNAYCALLKEYVREEISQRVERYLQIPQWRERLLDVVRDLHTVGVSYLDLALRNLVVSEASESLWLVDLGISRFIEDSFVLYRAGVEEDENALLRICGAF